MTFALWEFHTTFGLAMRRTPDAQIDADLADLRVALIQEEVDELAAAIKVRDIVEIADALADIVYVTFGAAVNFGVDLDAVIAEVHRSNMSKLDANGRPVLRADGKVGKSSLYEPPNVNAVLATQLPLPY